MWVCTSIRPGKQVARERSIADPIEPEAGPTEVMTPSASNVTIWSDNNCPLRTSSSFPQYTAPGAPEMAATESNHTLRARNILRIEFLAHDEMKMNQTSIARKCEVTKLITMEWWAKLLRCPRPAR